jgi:hypothetical protein
MKTDGRGDGSLEATRGAWRRAEAEAEAFAAATVPQRREATAEALGRGTAAAYRTLRTAAGPMLEDRPLDGDLRAVRRLLETWELTAEVAAALPDGLRPVTPLRGGE